MFGLWSNSSFSTSHFTDKFIQLRNASVMKVTPTLKTHSKFRTQTQFHTNLLRSRSNSIINSSFNLGYNTLQVPHSTLNKQTKERVKIPWFIGTNLQPNSFVIPFQFLSHTVAYIHSHYKKFTKRITQVLQPIYTWAVTAYCTIDEFARRYRLQAQQYPVIGKV